MQQNHSYICHLLRIALALLTLESVGFGQITNVTNDQSTPIPGAGHDYIKMLDETVNPATGSVSLRIQAPVPKGRGLTMPVAFTYDSNGVNHPIPDPVVGSMSWASNQVSPVNSYYYAAGWSTTIPTISWLYQVVTDSGGNSCDYITDFVFQDPGGGRHFFPLSMNIDTWGQCQSYAGRAPILQSWAQTDDNYSAVFSNASAYSPLQIADADGTTYYFGIGTLWGSSAQYTGPLTPFWIEDRNGNQISNVGGWPFSFSYSDTLGRSISLSGSGNTETLQLPGFSSPYYVTWGPISYSFSAPGQQVAYGYPCVTSLPGLNRTQEAITNIQLPNGQSYQFAYESTHGLLSQITYPNGAWVKYTWGVEPLGDAVGEPNLNGVPEACTVEYDREVVTKRTVSFDGVNTALEQDFSYSTSPITTTVTSTDFNAGTTSSTVYTYTTVPSTWGPNDYVAQPPAGAIYVEQSVAYKDGSGNTLRTVNKTWQDQNLMNCESTTQGGLTARTDYVYTPVWVNNPNFYNYYSMGMGFNVSWVYILGYELTDRLEWDWGQQSACPASSNAGWNSGIYQPPSGTPTRETLIQYQPFGNTPLFGSNGYANLAPIIDRPASVTINYNGVQAAQTTYAYDVGGVSPAGVSLGRDPSYNGAVSVRGNATSKTEWLNTGGQSPVTTYTYDDTGQQLSMTDPCGNANCPDMVDSDHTTQYHYSNYNAYLSEIDYPSTSGVPHIRYFTYNYGDGQLASSSDENTPPNYTSYKYNDSLDRLTEIDYPDGGKTTYAYGNACAQPSSTSILPSYSETAAMDGLCHVTLKTTSDPEGAVNTSTTYDGFGRVYQASNPYRSLSDPTYGLTTYTYDPLGRTININNPDQTNTSTVYGTNYSAQPGYCYTVTDAGGKTRRLWNDGLGRLTGVSEDPNNWNFQTSYTYNGLDDLLTVSQSGQTRTFYYDSLSRLIQAYNPEINVNGTPCLTTYNYDANGNLSSKAAPQPNQNVSCGNTVATSYGYDALNRVLYKDYYPDTTTVRAAYAYDGYGWAGPNQGFPNSVGHLTASWSVLHDGTVVAANETNYFDAMGRPQQGRECTPGTCGLTSGVTNYSWVVGYDFLGNETSLWESSLARYTPFDVVSRLSAMTVSPAAPQPSPPQTGTGTGPGTQSLINITAHHPCGGLTAATLGNNLAESRTYTSRCWLGSISVGSAYSLTNMSYAGNGNVLGATDSVNGAWTYQYDNVNRLWTATGAGQNFTYNPNHEPFGNMTCSNTGNLACTPLGFAISPATNQITTSGYTYDAAGNLLSDNTHGYVYDGENRIACVGVDINGNCTTNSTYYFYDPQGQRVGKQQYDTLEDYVYDPQGNIISVHDGSANLLRSELYSPGGRHVATWTPNPNGQYSDPYPPGLFWNHADWLGTERVRTDINGNLAETCTDTPYGMNLNCVDITVPADTGPMHFTGKQRDSESNLDYFSARYFGGGNSLGRFMTADPLMASAQVSSPQTWNRYIYGRNNPLKFLDPTGMKEETASDCAKDKLCVTVKLNVIYDKKANNGKGLTDKQKAGFGKQLQEAKDEYGNAHIHFDVAYGTSSVKGAENVIVSDSTPDMSAAFSGVRNGYAKTFLDVTQDDKETLSVELAHQFFGDTTGFADAFSRLEGTGMSNRLFDTYFDIRNDIARERLKVNNPFFMGSNYSLPEQLNEDFREGAREFQEAIRPQQK